MGQHLGHIGILLGKIQEIKEECLPSYLKHLSSIGPTKLPTFSSMKSTTLPFLAALIIMSILHFSSWWGRRTEHSQHLAYGTPHMISPKPLYQIKDNLMQPVVFIKSSFILIIKQELESNIPQRVIRTVRLIRLAQQKMSSSIGCIYIHDHLANIEVVVALQSSSGWSEILVSVRNLPSLYSLCLSAWQHQQSSTEQYIDKSKCCRLGTM